MDGKPRDFRLIVNLQEGGKVGGANCGSGNSPLIEFSAFRYFPCRPRIRSSSRVTTSAYGH